MPLYEYYCKQCDGVFEAIRSMRESSEPVPCPECYRDAQRIMPTSFQAFTMRDGYPRRIPDRGTYWHLGQEVKRPINVPTPPNEHPDLMKEKEYWQPKPKTKAQFKEEQELKVIEQKQEKRKQEGYQKDITRAKLGFPGYQP